MNYWAYKITTNKSIDWIRRSKAVKQISIEEIQDQEHKDKKDTGIKREIKRLELRIAELNQTVKNK